MALETAFKKAIESKKSVDEKMEVKSNCAFIAAQCSLFQK